MSSRKWSQAPQTPIDKETIYEMEEESGVRYKMRERSKWQKKNACCIADKRICGRRSKPLQRPGWSWFNIGGVRTKKAFLLGAERKLRNAVRREKAQYLYEREAQNPDGEFAIVADAAR